LAEISFRTYISHTAKLLEARAESAQELLGKTEQH